MSANDPDLEYFKYLPGTLFASNNNKHYLVEGIVLTHDGDLAYLMKGDQGYRFISQESLEISYTKIDKPRFVLLQLE